MIFLARDLIEGDPEFEETENITVRKLPLEDALQEVLDGRITDAISIAGLLRAARFVD